ncbi:Molybdate-anion transporter [Apophysomyces ossiformis]|uniref:Molybdate-anion transporter n=1 Tax=Apophysomyces ossiformis TaxID=679940 RepID=A0A8H7BVC2_9FUNG|nr:Molybdate-anion transporter [Apophysomyces ossiformis]
MAGKLRRTVQQNSRILVLGAAQTFFECSMYTFVLLYTPVIENAVADKYGADNELPLGYLFSTLMFAVMLGSLAFQTVDRQTASPASIKFVQHLTKDRLLAVALGLASVAFAIMAYYERSSLSLLILAYHIFEFTTGLYYPSISSLKAEAIPEESRAAVMTLLRIPMNLGVGVIMWHVDDLSTSMMFAICAVMAMFGCSLVTSKY